MKTLINLCLAVVLTVVLLGCKSDSVTNSGGTTLDTASFKYPLNIGSTWSFTRTITASDIHPDSILHYFSNYPRITSGTAAALYDTVINGISTTCLLEVYTDSTPYYSRLYMVNNDTAFIEYAHTGYSFFTSYMRTVNTNGFEINQIDNTPREGITINDPPYEILEYPVITGKQWTAYRTYGVARIRTKKYEGWENINIGTNQISCMKTSCIMSISPSDGFILYYSKYGLLKIYSRLDDLLVTTPEHPEGIGTADITDTYMVTSYNLP